MQQRELREPGAGQMSRERDDGMGDVIRKASPPPAEGSYKKVKAQKGTERSLCVPRSCGNAARIPPGPVGFGGLEQGESAVCKVLARGKPSSFLLSLSAGAKIAGEASRGVLLPGNPRGFKAFCDLDQKVLTWVCIYPRKRKGDKRTFCVICVVCKSQNSPCAEQR